MIPYAKRRGRRRKLDRLPPDAYPVLDRMLRAGYCVPYIAEQIEARFGCAMPSPCDASAYHYHCYAIERNIPRPGARGCVTYLVATLIDPDRPFLATLETMAGNDETVAEMRRTLRAMGAPLAPGSRSVIVSALRAAGIPYQVHRKGGYHRDD